MHHPQYQHQHQHQHQHQQIAFYRFSCLGGVLVAAAMAAERFLAEFGNLTFESMIEQECQIKAKKNPAGCDEIVEEEEE